MMAGGREFGQPSFSDAIPNDPPNQGDPGPDGMGSNRTDENTWAGDDHDARMDMGHLVPGDNPQNLRGYHTAGIGGSYNPGNGKGSGSSAGAERSSMAGE